MENKSKVYNLSYDNSVDLALPQQDNLFNRKQMLEFLVNENILELQRFQITHNNIVKDTPYVVNVVKTTLIFHSYMAIDDIRQKLRSLKNYVYYVLTLVQEDENHYLGAMRADEELQASCDAELDDILENNE